MFRKKEEVVNVTRRIIVMSQEKTLNIFKKIKQDGSITLPSNGNYPDVIIDFGDRIRGGDTGDKKAILELTVIIDMINYGDHGLNLDTLVKSRMFLVFGDNNEPVSVYFSNMLSGMPSQKDGDALELRLQ